MDDTNVKCYIYCEDLATNRKKLFEQALLFAKQGKVLYILKNELSELPEISQDLNLVNRYYMKMISFLYAQCLDSVIESLSSLPDWTNIPSTIILDSLNEYCSLENLQNACAMVALLIDTARSCSISLKTDCRVFVSITKQLVDEEFCCRLQDLYCLQKKD